MTRHVHHWKIESPRGQTSTGRCTCGAEKDFENHLSVESRSRPNSMAVARTNPREIAAGQRAKARERRVQQREHAQQRERERWMNERWS